MQMSMGSRRISQLKWMGTLPPAYRMLMTRQGALTVRMLEVGFDASTR